MGVPCVSRFEQHLKQRAEQCSAGKARALRQLAQRERFANDDRLPAAVRDALEVNRARGAMVNGEKHCEWCDSKLKGSFDFCPGCGAFVADDWEL